MRRLQLFFRAGILALMLVTSTGIATSAADAFSCRASALRVEDITLSDNLNEPTVANPGSDPCVTSQAYIFSGSFTGTFSVVNIKDASNLLLATTTNTPGQGASAHAAAFTNVLHIDSPGVLTVDLTSALITSDANVECLDGAPLLSGDSTVLTLTGTIKGTGPDGVTFETAFRGTHRPASQDIDIPGFGTLHLNYTKYETNKVTQRAVWLELGDPDGIGPLPNFPDVIISEAIADFHGNPCLDSTLPPKSGRLTGGGTLSGPNGTSVAHGFELHCDIRNLPNNLEINWSGNNFHLLKMTKAKCEDTGAVPNPPNASFDTHSGEGSGTCNGSPAIISWRLTDAGEPGSSDNAEFHITGACVLDVGPSNLNGGNHQAHKT